MSRRASRRTYRQTHRDALSLDYARYRRQDGGPQGADMRVQSLSGTKFRPAVVPCLCAVIWLYAMAPFPAAAQQKADDAARKHPPTILATPPFGVPNLHTQCLAVNLTSTP